MQKSEIKSGVVLSYVAILISLLISLFYTPFLVRTLGQSEHGLYSLVSSTIGYLSILDLGFGNAIVVFTAKYRATNNIDKIKQLHGMFRIVFLIIGVVSAILGMTLFINVDNLFGNTMTDVELNKTRIMMIILIINLSLSFAFSIYSSIISAYEKFVYQKIVAIATLILKPIITIPFLMMGYKSVTLCLILTIINIITIFSNFIYCRKKLNITIHYSGFDRTLFFVILGYSFWNLIGIIIDKVNWSVDNFILGSICGTKEVSVYAMAGNFNSIFISVSTAISGLLLPRVSMMVAKESSDDEITNEFIKVGRLQYLVIFLMASCLVLFGKQFFISWAGPNYVNSYYIAMFLILPVCVPLIQNLGVSVLQAKNKHKFRSLTYLFIAVFNVIISIPLAKLYGGIGASMGTAISLLAGNGIIINIYYYKKIHIDVIKFWKNIMLMTIPFIIPIVIILIIMSCIKLAGIVSVIVYGVIYTCMYLFIAYKFSMNDYERNIALSFVNYIKK